MGIIPWGLVSLSSSCLCLFIKRGKKIILQNLLLSNVKDIEAISTAINSPYCWVVMYALSWRQS